MLRPRLVAVVAGLTAWATGLGAADDRAALAGAREVDVSLSYRGSDRCPSRSSVAAQLQARGLRVLAVPGDKHLSIEVIPDPADARRFRGQLTVAAPAQETLSRNVVGRDCGAVTQSLALVAGVALNPTDGDPPEDGGVAATAGQGAGEDATTPVWYAGVTGRGTSAIGDGPALGGSAFVERVWGNRPGVRLSGVLSLTTIAPATMTLGSGSADLRAYLGRLDGCWFGGLHAGRGVTLSPCAGVEFGVVRGEGSIARPRAATRPWLAPGLSARAAVALTHRVWLFGAAYAYAPVVRDTFVFNVPRATIFRTPAVGGGLDLGFAGAFW